MDGAAIKATVPGAVLKLDTPLGMVVPITFGGDGLMSGDAGALASYLGSPRDRGRYWIAEDRICYKWFRWFDAEQHCLAIEREGQKIIWKRDDGEAGTATLEERRKPAPSQVASAAAETPRQVRSPIAASNAVFPPDARQPVLVKLPTLAVRPQRRSIDLAKGASPSSLSLIESQNDIR